MNLNDLNPQQRQAVTCVDRPCLVLAGAGSGKTGVITRKIGWLIERGFDPSRICALTFTNKSAREMKQRVSKLVSGNTSRGLIVSTFHSLGQRILVREAHRLGYRRGFSILDARDTEACLADLAHRELSDTDQLRAARHQISRWKNDFVEPEAALAQAETALLQSQARLYREYQEQLRACNSMDFDDLIMLPVHLLRTDTEVLEYWQGRIHYLLIDEYQDTNTSQYELIRLICGIRQKFTAVGDDDQSIYAWRGARPENLQRLQQDFPALEIIMLEQNYRSTGRILNVANGLISNNGHLYEKRLWSETGPGERIRVLPCRSAEDEAERIAIDILSCRFQENATPGDFAILYRSNFQSRIYEKALRDHSINYEVTGAGAFFERREIRDLMAYLRFLTNPDDDQALLRVINVPRREIGAGTIKAIATHAESRHCNLDKAMRELGLLEALGHRARLRVERFTDQIDELRRAVESVDAMNLCRELIDRIEYRPWLEETATSPRQAEAANENVDELISWIGNLQGQRDDPGLVAVMAHLSLMSILENDRDRESADAVQLMTIHAAKGLEFNRVYLAGFEEDSLPHHQSQSEAGLEEERRLAYVGITRARQKLTLTYAKTRQKYGERIQCEPSRFLFELPESDLDGAEHTQSDLSEEEQFQKGLDTFADLQAILGRE